MDTHNDRPPNMDTKPPNDQPQSAAIITISPELRKRVRIRVAQLGTTIKSFCEEAIRKHLVEEDDHK